MQNLKTAVCAAYAHNFWLVLIHGSKFQAANCTFCGMHSLPDYFIYIPHAVTFWAGVQGCDSWVLSYPDIIPSCIISACVSFRFQTYSVNELTLIRFAGDSTGTFYAYFNWGASSNIFIFILIESFIMNNNRMGISLSIFHRKVQIRAQNSSFYRLLFSCHMFCRTHQLLHRCFPSRSIDQSTTNNFHLGCMRSSFKFLVLRQLL